MDLDSGSDVGGTSDSGSVESNATEGDVELTSAINTYAKANKMDGLKTTLFGVTWLIFWWAGEEGDGARPLLLATETEEQKSSRERAEKRFGGRRNFPNAIRRARKCAQLMRELNDDEERGSLPPLLELMGKAGDFEEGFPPGKSTHSLRECGHCG